MKKRILIVTSEFPPQPGGIGNHAYNLAQQLSLNDFKVSVIADQRSISGEEEREFDAGLNVEVHRIKWRPFRGFMYVSRFLRLMKMVQTVDVVIASGKFSLWNVACCSFLHSKKYMAVIHGTEVNFKNKYLRKSIEAALKRFDVIVAVSNYTKSLIYHLNLSVTVIPNGYDSTKWKREVEADTNLKGFPKLITIGNVTSRKGQMNVISHLPLIKSKYPNIHYHCIGLSTEVEAFSKRAKELLVQAQVTFHGRLNDIEMQSMLRASDIFVMLSGETHTGDVEGFGIAVIEANALGIPAIGATGSGLEDAIADKTTGFLVDKNNSGAFLESMKELLKHKESFSQNSIEWAAQHQWDRIIKLYISLIN